MLLPVPRNGFQNHSQGLVREASSHSILSVLIQLSKRKLSLFYLRISTIVSVPIQLSKRKLALFFVRASTIASVPILTLSRCALTFCVCASTTLGIHLRLPQAGTSNKPTHMVSNEARKQPQSRSQRLLSIHKPRLRKPENRNSIAAPKSGPILKDMQKGSWRASRCLYPW